MKNMTSTEAQKAYNKLPTTSSPEDFLEGLGNWGLNEREYRLAKRLAKIATGVLKKKYKKLTPREKKLASKYIPEEIKTKQYPRKQAIAIGISRAVAKAKKTSHKSNIQRIMDKYR
jgi:hypothetical protein